VKGDVVHVEFSVRNATDVPALDGEITLIICDLCKFASEPEEFTKLAGQVDTQRNHIFQRILPQTELKRMTADVRVPGYIAVMQFGIDYRCRTCVIPKPKENIGTVFLARSN
jgi:hypothetical protein